MTKHRIKGDYSTRRRGEYPPLEDLADAMFHAKNGDQSKLETYMQRVAAVKAKFPKPAAPALPPDIKG